MRSADDPATGAIVGAIIDLSHVLGLTVVTAGVETQSKLNQVIDRVRKACATVSANAGPTTWRPETLTDTWVMAWPYRRWQALRYRQAWPSTHSPMGRSSHLTQ